MNKSFIATLGSGSSEANPSKTCDAPAKWAIIVNDQLFPVPRREITTKVILEQTGQPPDTVLVRDYGGNDDSVLPEKQLIDLADGNVFKTSTRCGAPEHRQSKSPPKLAFVVNDSWELTLTRVQTSESLRGLFNLSPMLELLRDHESPHDETLAPGQPIRFDDGPVFISRKSNEHCCREMKIIVNGRERTVDGDTISYESLVQLAFGNASSDTIYTITFKKGPPANPQGSMVAGSVVKLECGMIFNVTATTKS
jgi:hypothetical protein